MDNNATFIGSIIVALTALGSFYFLITKPLLSLNRTLTSHECTIKTLIKDHEDLESEVNDKIVDLKEGVNSKFIEVDKKIENLEDNNRESHKRIWEKIDSIRNGN